ncbi:MAG: AAA15 family ATPase/GTPase [Phenylobacterium sp.]|jgi:AAA15 family ATPase/GTPase
MKQHSDQGYALNRLYLDPNNYRFIDDVRYVKVTAQQAADPKVQKRTLNFICGNDNTHINDLMYSFKQYGYLPVEWILVNDISDQQCMVVEGNRRIAALKQLQEQHEQGLDIGKLDPAIFSNIPVLFSDLNIDDELSYKLVKGFKHIGTNQKWPVINRASLINNLECEHKIAANQLRRSLRVNISAMQSIKAVLGLVDMYKKSDYAEQFSSDKYTLFQAFVKDRVLVGWLDQSRDLISGKFDGVDEYKLKRLFSWLSVTENFIDEVESDGSEFSEYPAVRTVMDVKELSKIIEDENALSNLEETQSLSSAIVSSEVLGKEKLSKAIELIKEQVNIIDNYAYHLKEDNLKGLTDSANHLNLLLQAKNQPSPSAESHILSKRAVVEQCEHHFSALTIKQYKKFSGLEINSLGQVNLFAGINNSGKSSILEAIYVLTKLGEIKSILQVNKQRQKSQGADKFINQFKSSVDKLAISAVFNGKSIDLQGTKEADDSIVNQSGYVGSLYADASYDNVIYTHRSAFYEDKVAHQSSKNLALCNSIISSSSFIDEEYVFKDCYEQSIRNGAKNTVVDFIKTYIDPQLIDIQLMSQGTHFFVEHQLPSKCLELSQYGDGLQKIFYLGIKLAACTNGTIFLDEIENGIHKSLLIQFTELIQRMAEQYNVQVFVTSHSKECIDAFLTNGYHNHTISAYALSEENGGKVDHYAGEELENLIGYIDLDIRGQQQ